MVELLTEDQSVAGSIPVPLANFTGIEFRMTNGESPDFKGGQTVNSSTLYFREIRMGRPGEWKRCCYFNHHQAMLDVTYLLSCSGDGQ